MGNLSSLSPYYRAGVGEAMGAAYRPAMMEFDGSTGYYTKTSVSVSGNKTTFALKFKRDSFLEADSDYEIMIRLGDGSTGRLQLLIISNDNSTLTNRQGCLQMDATNTGSTNIVKIISKSVLADGEEHTVLASFDGDTGDTTFIVDGVDEDDTTNPDRVAPTTGTVTTTGVQFDLGSSFGSRPFEGSLGFAGCDDQYLTNWSDFMDSNGNPIKQDETTWAGFGSQPLFWNEHGFMEDNRGSAGDMTKNGTINIADTEVVT